MLMILIRLADMLGFKVSGNSIIQSEIEQIKVRIERLNEAIKRNEVHNDTLTAQVLAINRRRLENDNANALAGRMQEVYQSFLGDDM